MPFKPTEALKHFLLTGVLNCAHGISLHGANTQRGPFQPHNVVSAWPGPRWFGYTFDDSPASVNPWSAPVPVPSHVLGDLEPVAPLDRLDHAWVDSVTGTAPVQPSQRLKDARNVANPMPPDWVPPLHRPVTFPGDHGHSDAPPEDPTVPLQDKNLVARMDRLRPGYGTLDFVWSEHVNPAFNYPGVAPADKVAGEPVGTGDTVPPRFAKFVDQVYARNQKAKKRKMTAQVFNNSDLDQDGAVSPEEFAKILQGQQNKSSGESDRLWNKFHTSTGTDMTKEEFSRLADSGFDLGAIPRDDIGTVLAPPGLLARGFWGSGAACPPGAFMTGARLKIMPPTPGADNTGLNAVGVKCTDGTEKQTVEGPDGAWTPWQQCPAGQQVYSYRLRNQMHIPGRDDAGIQGLELRCRAPDLSAFSTLSFTKFASGIVAAGWTPELMCPPKQAVCGAQANVLRDQGDEDDMGMTNIRVYCCNKKVDCNTVCSGSSAMSSVKCSVCQQVLNGGA